MGRNNAKQRSAGQGSPPPGTVFQSHTRTRQAKGGLPPAPKPPGAHQGLGRGTLQETAAEGERETMQGKAACTVLPLSPGDSQPLWVPGLQAGSWAQVHAAAGLHNQGGVNGQERGQETETKNQSESTHKG